MSDYIGNICLDIISLFLHFKGTCILFQFLFLMEKSIPYAKIPVSQNFFFPKLSFKYDIGLLFS